MRGYDRERSAPENVALALYEIAAALRTLSGDEGTSPVVEAALIIKDGLESIGTADLGATENALDGIAGALDTIAKRK